MGEGEGKKVKSLHQGIYPWAHDRFVEQCREGACEKGFMTAEGLKCVTVVQELIPDTRALCRCTLGVWLHSGADAEGEQSPATVHVALLFAVEWQVRRKHPAYLVNKGMGGDVFCSLPGHCSTASISLPSSRIWKCGGFGRCLDFFSLPIQWGIYHQKLEMARRHTFGLVQPPKFRIAVMTGKSSTLCHKPSWESVCGDVSALAILWEGSNYPLSVLTRYFWLLVGRLRIGT